MFVIIVMGTLAPLARYWFAGLTLIHRDQTGQYAPLRTLVSQALKEGRLPLWDPFCATGMPYMADIMHGVLHPFSLAAALISPGNDIDLLIGVYILAAAAGAAVFARTMGASRAASILAAFAYALSGYTLSMSSNMVNLAGAGSVPWILAGLRAVACNGTAPAFAAGTIAVAAGALSGDVQELAVAILVGCVLAVVGGGQRGFIRALTAVFIGLLVAAIQLVPSWEFFNLSSRVLPLHADDINQWDLAPWRLVEFISPGFFTWPEDGWGTAPVYMALGHPTNFGIPFAESVYIGAATVLLAGAGFLSGRKSYVLSMAAVVLLWFAMGKNFGARSLQNFIPVASGFRYGEKFLPTFNACVAMLAASGADRITGDRVMAKRFLILTGIVAGLLIVFLLLLQRVGISVEGWGADVPIHLAAGLPHAIAAVIALSGCLFLVMKGRNKLALCGLVVVVWCSVASASYFALRPGHPEARISVAPPEITSTPPGPRVLNLKGALPRPPKPGWDSIDQLNFDVLSSLGANTNARHHIDNMDVDTGLFPLRYYLLREAFGRGFPVVARRFGITHVFFPPPKSANGKEIVATATSGGTYLGTDTRNGIQIWQVPHRSWASFPSQVIVCADRKKALDSLLSREDGDWNNVLVETNKTLPVSTGKILTVSRKTERLEIVAESEENATLVVNDAFWPGWRARIDGSVTEIFPADVLVRAVKWPAGRHTLVMEYAPPEVRMGKWLSCSGLILLVGMCFLLWRRTSDTC